MKTNKGMSIVTLKEEPVKKSNPAIELANSLLSKEFSNNHWRTYTYTDMYNMVREGTLNTDIHSVILFKKLTKCKTREDILIVLSEVALSNV